MSALDDYTKKVVKIAQDYERETRAQKGRVVALTDTELSLLRVALGSIGEDIDCYGLSPAEKRAYERTMKKLYG